MSSPLKTIEPLHGFALNRNRETKKLELRMEPRKGLYLYHYYQHPVFGFLHVRLQTWLPFQVQIWLNGREWLARTLDRERIAYERRDNCFSWIANVERAQRLMDEQLATRWPFALIACARGHIRHTRRCSLPGPSTTHYVDGNSVKIYDKHGTVLRAETTINIPSGFKVYRTAEGDDAGQPGWRPMRKGIADLTRRAEVSQAINDRYLDALASCEDTSPLGELTADLCRPVTWNGRRARALQRRAEATPVGVSPLLFPVIAISPERYRSRPHHRWWRPEEHGGGYGLPCRRTNVTVPSCATLT